jgi:hypothetical protein
MTVTSLAQLREGGHSDAKSVETVMKLLREIKSKWKHVQLTVVMDTGFNGPELLEELEKEDVLYAIGYPAAYSAEIGRPFRRIRPPFTRMIYGVVEV